MPCPKEPVKRICYADDITVCTSGVKLPELEHKINDYLTEMSRFLRDNSLLISAPKSTVTLFTPDPKQANTRPKIKISDAELPLVRNPKLLGAPQMCRYPPSTIHIYLDLPSTQIMQTHTPPLPTLVQAPLPTPHIHHRN